MSELVRVKLSEVDPPPLSSERRLPEDDPRKMALRASVSDLGMQATLIGRRAGNRVQLAAGKLRLEVAEELGLREIPIAISKFSDEEMIRFAGLEQQEVYNTDFPRLYGTYVGAIKFAGPRKSGQLADNARMLGWTTGDGAKANATARACDAAYRLIEGGHMDLEDLAGLSVNAAQKLVERVLSRIEMLAKLGKLGGRPAQEIADDQKTVAEAAKSVAGDVREGSVAHKNISQEIDFRAVQAANKDEKPSPLFAHFARKLADQLHKMVVSDPAATRLAEIEKALPLVTMEEDVQALKRIDFALGALADSADKWRHRLKEPRGEKVVAFKRLAKMEER